MNILRNVLMVFCVLTLLVSAVGCDYGQAVGQNLHWGFDEMMPHLIANTVGSFAELLLGALVNGAVFGVQ